jgi:hypothetical protein
VTDHLHTITVIDGKTNGPVPAVMLGAIQRGMCTWPFRFSVVETTGSACVVVKQSDGWKPAIYVPPMMEFHLHGTGMIQVCYSEAHVSRRLV